MRGFFFLKFAAAATLISSVTAILMLRFFHRLWWRNKFIRVSVFALAGAAILFLIVWTIGIYVNSRPVYFLGGALVSAMLLLQVGLLLTLPLSGIIHLGVDISAKISERINRNKDNFSPGRRNFIKNSAAVIPGLALTSQLTGVAGSYGGIRVPVLRLPVTNLPEKLRGLKIAHLSDSHLGIYKHLDDLERAVEKIKSRAPDLVLYTGDISDNLDILAEANRIVAELNPPFGIFASAGNHEYYRGIGRVISIFEKSPYPLLLERGVAMEINGVPVYIGGANDPVHLRGVDRDFLQKTVEKTIIGAPADAFKILMSHRPQGLDPASDFNIDVVLAGHTHGGQVGIGHRSLFESLWPEMYLWGIYRKKNTTLYTSGGMGHWLPFRLGCPAEAPILILDKTDETEPV
jgi:predicted MPP superfamily phosphohydrolase